MPGQSRCRECGSRIFWGPNPYKPGGLWRFDDPGFVHDHVDSCSATVWADDPISGARYRVSPCRDCQAGVAWVTNARGRRQPMAVEGHTVQGYDHRDVCGKKAGEAFDSVWAGADRISSARSSANPYREWCAVLELGWPTTRAELVSAFREKAKQAHPDAGGSEAEFIKVRHAYEFLKERVA